MKERQGCQAGRRRWLAAVNCSSWLPACSHRCGRAPRLSHMQHAWKHVERPGGSHTALDGKKVTNPDHCPISSWTPGMTPISCTSSGTEEARTCEALFQLTFRPQKWNLKAHMWYQLSPFPSSNVAICAAAPPRQHSPILRYSGYSATPCCVFIQLPNVIDTISKRWRSKKAFNTLPSHIFS